MNKILRTTLATAFAAACLAGASVTFAADNGGQPGKDGVSSDNGTMNDNDSDVLPTDPSATNSIKTCDNNAASQQNCTKDGVDQTQQK